MLLQKKWIEIVQPGKVEGLKAPIKMENGSTIELTEKAKPEPKPEPKKKRREKPRKDTVKIVKEEPSPEKPAEAPKDESDDK